MPALSPPFTTLLAAVICAIAGYYVGKTSGLRKAENIHELNGKDTVVLDDNFGAGADRNTGIKAIDKKGKGKAKVDAEDGEDVEWESEDENGEDEEDDDGGVNINKFENSHEACKMVLIVRSDLGMTKGKIAAQCGHATLMCYKASQKHAPHLVRAWENYGQTKIALQAKGEDELNILQAQAMSLGVVAKIVHDAGRTQIAAGSATVLGIGPAPVSVVNEISGHLKLL
ncbi:uncharacterized protein LAJ45_06592 [Morchella importuna]|uniref:peptidyl-tRNA hydrolase n=1 Tax=Morchella conica CCBAS932 TaxID=1392247 RepID=A0A3N4L363_9PEZI|nr:uncharacterized protein LAJ45_06592 [Morchella importuna]KAH8149512.1 hypothetical protein LAJ45_06592 [Morchella importuna]RPB17297.1 PTH2-domain-containing protein [Morchella conica CCBAS932]